MIFVVVLDLRIIQLQIKCLQFLKILFIRLLINSSVWIFLTRGGGTIEALRHVPHQNLAW